MNDFNQVAVAQFGPAEDPLVYLQTLVARRADELWNAYGRQPGHDLECWLQAENDIFDGSYSEAALTAH